MSQSNAALNRAVAEQAMGWKLVEGSKAVAEFEGVSVEQQTTSRLHSRRIWVLNGKRMACEECGNMPDFCSYENMGRVLERMRELGWVCRIYYGHNCQASFDSGNGIVRQAESDSLPKAVALAAVKSVGGKG